MTHCLATIIAHVEAWCVPWSRITSHSVDLARELNASEVGVLYGVLYGEYFVWSNF